MAADVVWPSPKDLGKLSEELSVEERGAFWRWTLEQASRSDPGGAHGTAWDGCLRSLIMEQTTALQALMLGPTGAVAKQKQEPRKGSTGGQEKASAFAAGVGLLHFSHDWIIGLADLSRQQPLQQYLADQLVQVVCRLHQWLVIEEAKGAERGEWFWMGWELLKWRRGMAEPLPPWWPPVWEQVVRLAALEWMQQTQAADPLTEEGQLAITRTLTLLQVLAPLHNPLPDWIPEVQRQVAQRGLAAVLQSEPLTNDQLQSAATWLGLLTLVGGQQEEIALTDTAQDSVTQDLRQLRDRLQRFDMAELLPLELRLLLQVSEVVTQGHQLIQQKHWQESQQLFEQLAASIGTKIENTAKGIWEKLLEEISYSLACILEPQLINPENEISMESNTKNQDLTEDEVVARGLVLSYVVGSLRSILTLLGDHHALLPAKKLFHQGMNDDAQGSWNQLICAALNPELQSAPEYTRWQACSGLILSRRLTAAQVLGASLDMCLHWRLEGASRGFKRLVADNIVSIGRLIPLCVQRLGLADRYYQDNRPPSATSTATGTALYPETIDQMQDAAITRIIQSSNEVAHQDKNEFLASIANPVILVAGMRHSGSTALFNIARIGLEKANLMCHSGYSELTKEQELRLFPGLRHVIKIHELRDDLLSRGDIIITTRRDLRDTVASAKRRGFDMLKASKSVWNYAAYNRTLHEQWEQFSDYEFNYEDFIANPKAVIADVLSLIGCPPESCDEVALAIKQLPTNQYKKTLLSSTHVTDPERKLSFRDTLSEEEVYEIERRNNSWLAKHGYCQ